MLVELPVWGLAIVIFLLRIVDVSLGVVRMLTVVQGRMKSSVVLGFLEVVVWIAAVAPVIVNVSENIGLAFAYAGGFAAGNAVGIWLQHRFASGPVVLRVIPTEQHEEIIRYLTQHGAWVTTFDGEGVKGDEKMIVAALRRRNLDQALDFIDQLDPGAMYVVEQALESKPSMYPPLPMMGRIRPTV
jgi:uncharacterized protein YebE (UPF0316 family)